MWDPPFVLKGFAPGSASGAGVAGAAEEKEIDIASLVKTQAKEDAALLPDNGVVS